MEHIISWGGGVNSTAIIAMMKLGMLPEFTKENSHIVFADTGAEMPYTYEHTNDVLSPMARDGWRVKTVSPHNTSEYYTPSFQKLTLPEYCLSKIVMPSRVNRWCTMEYKSKPIKKYGESLGEIVLVLGIAHDEQHRAKARYSRTTYYPLIEKEVNRDRCIELIKEAGLPEAKKSGCFLCPYQRKAQWLDTYKNHPDLFAQAEQIETNANIRFKDKGYYLVRDLPIREQIEKWIKMEKKKCQQMEFDEFGLDQHCFCAD